VPLTSATVQTGTTVSGRVLARNGQVSLHANTITRPTCNVPTPNATTSPGGGVPTGVPAGSGGEATTTSQTTRGVEVLALATGIALLAFGGYGASRRRSRRR